MLSFGNFFLNNQHNLKSNYTIRQDVNQETYVFTFENLFLLEDILTCRRPIMTILATPMSYCILYS